MSEEGVEIKEAESLPEMLDLEPLGITNPTNDERQRVYNENYPAILGLSEKGVKFYQVPSNVFFEKLAEGVQFGKLDAIKNWNKDCAVACQIGEDRSQQFKTMSYDIGAPVAMIPEDEKELRERNKVKPFAKIGMSYAQLGRRIKNGKFTLEGIIPEGFKVPITRVIGFTDSLHDLYDVDQFASEVQKLYQANSAAPKLEIIIVEGKSDDIRNGTNALKSRLKLKTS